MPLHGRLPACRLGRQAEWQLPGMQASNLGRHVSTAVESEAGPNPTTQMWSPSLRSCPAVSAAALPSITIRSWSVVPLAWCTSCVSGAIAQSAARPLSCTRCRADSRLRAGASSTRRAQGQRRDSSGPARDQQQCGGADRKAGAERGGHICLVNVRPCLVVGRCRWKAAVLAWRPRHRVRLACRQPAGGGRAGFQAALLGACCCAEARVVLPWPARGLRSAVVPTMQKQGGREAPRSLHSQATTTPQRTCGHSAPSGECWGRRRRC